jgi:hypothetical protein
MAARRRGNPIGVRKVRAPQRRVVGNTHPPRGEDQRHSDDAGDSFAGVKRGKLYPEQGQIGGRPPGSPGVRALHSPRVGRTSRRVTDGLRWMAIAVPLRRCGTELGLQAALADVPFAPRISVLMRERPLMYDFQTIKLMHRHGADDYAPMVETSEHGPEAHDPERAWLRGARIFKCSKCEDEILVTPPGESSDHPFQGA